MQYLITLVVALIAAGLWVYFYKPNPHMELGDDIWRLAWTTVVVFAVSGAGVFAVKWMWG